MKVGKYNVTPKNIASFIRGTSKKYLDDLDISELSDSESSQVILRAILCSDCMTNGSCIGKDKEGNSCNCKTPDMFYDPKKSCVEAKWGEMLNDTEWERFSSEMFSVYSKSYANIYKARMRSQNRPQNSIIPFETSNTEYDFGTVEFGKPITHTFKLENTLDSNMQIKSVTPSCNCTAPTFSKTLVKPGDNMEVTLKYTNDAVGKFRKQATVVFTNPNVLPITVVITGNAISKPKK